MGKNTRSATVAARKEPEKTRVNEPAGGQGEKGEGEKSLKKWEKCEGEKRRRGRLRLIAKCIPIRGHALQISKGKI